MSLLRATSQYPNLVALPQTEVSFAARYNTTNANKLPYLYPESAAALMNAHAVYN